MLAQRRPDDMETMQMIKETLISEIQKYINNNGGVASGYGWYVGVTVDPKRRLFREHNVNE